MYVLSNSSRSNKKLMVQKIDNTGTKTGSPIHFGSSGYDDFSSHKDVDRRDRYLSRHEPREDWTQSGLNTAGFWARWILWNKNDLFESIIDTSNRFGIPIRIG